MGASRRRSPKSTLPTRGRRVSARSQRVAALRAFPLREFEGMRLSRAPEFAREDAAYGARSPAAVPRTQFASSQRPSRIERSRTNSAPAAEATPAGAPATRPAVGGIADAHAMAVAAAIAAAPRVARKGFGP